MAVRVGTDAWGQAESEAVCQSASDIREALTVYTCCKYTPKLTCCRANLLEIRHRHTSGCTAFLWQPPL